MSSITTFLKYEIHRAYERDTGTPGFTDYITILMDTRMVDDPDYKYRFEEQMRLFLAELYDTASVRVIGRGHHIIEEETV